MKIGHLAKAIAQQRLEPMQNGQFGSKIKNATDMRETIQLNHYSCSVQKNYSKKHQDWRNETIFKIGYLAKTIAHAKAMTFGKW